MVSPSFDKQFRALVEFQRNPFHPLVCITGRPVFGKNVYIGALSEVYAKGGRVVIGDNCDIASFVAINCADTHLKSLGLQSRVPVRDIILENNVFVGSHCVIKGGAYIGHHTVIAAGTIVDGKRIAPYSLVTGNPMRVRAGYYRSRLLKSSTQRKKRA